MYESRPCGSWDSPIGSEDLVRGALRLSAPRVDAGRLFWLEGRPSEGGRQVVIMTTLRDAALAKGGAVRQGDAREASPAGVNVRTRVHEYGGGEYTIWRDRLFFVDDAGERAGEKAEEKVGGRIHAGRIAGPSTALTPAGARYADLVVSADGAWLFAVEERPREGAELVNRLIAIRLREAATPAGIEAVGDPIVVAAGHDFYASPTLSPTGQRLAFLAWDHPHMPWNETRLETLEWGADGPRGEARLRAGGQGESLFQPRFAADGRLFVVSDRSGWWNLARLDGEGLRPVHSDRFEIGRAQWVFGQSTWDFLDSATVLASATAEGVDQLVRIDLESGAVQALPNDFRTIGGVQVAEGWATCLAASATRATTLFAWPSASASPEPEAVRESAPFEIPAEAVSAGVARVFASRDGRTTHAFVYAPRSGSQTALPGERPPLLVKSHGGPTAATSAALDPRIQYWTSRGFAVADVNYGGSTGYGRAYRDQLEHRWGIVDVEDCVAVARALAEEGAVDKARLAISGGSAGGYTTLCALTFHDVFAAGASHYGIGDLEALARDTHKFESRYTDWLVGPLPEARDRYLERSPIHHPERLGCPMIFFQGEQDKVVPPSQARAMVEVLARRGIPHAYVPFEGEQHGFRRAENIRKALDGELYFYSRVFGFDAPKPDGVDVVTGEKA